MMCNFFIFIAPFTCVDRLSQINLLSRKNLISLGSMWASTPTNCAAYILQLINISEIKSIYTIAPSFPIHQIPPLSGYLG